MILEKMYILILKLTTNIINSIIIININQNLINNSKEILQRIISTNTITKLYSIILLMHSLLMISHPMIKIMHTPNINHSNSVDIFKLNHSKKFNYDQFNHLILIILSHYLFIY